MLQFLIKYCWGVMFVVAVLLAVVLFAALFLFGIRQEQKLIQTFKDNDFSLDKEAILQNSNNFEDCFEITLVNLGFLPSYRGEYQSILFKNKFYLELYETFDILTLNTSEASYKIKLPKSASRIKSDLFTGKLLEIKVKGQALLFRLPNEMQNVIYKRI